MESAKNGKAALISGIEKDARLEAETIVAEAEKQVEERRKNISKQIQSIHDEAEKKAAEQAKAIKKKVLAGVDVDVKRRTIRLRDEIMKDMLRGVEKELHALVNKKAYRAILQNWIVEAAVGLGVELAEVNASRDELKYIDKKFIGETETRVQKILCYSVTLKVSKEHPLRAQGVILTAKNGRTAYNNQTYTRLLRKQREIRKHIYDNLFTEE